MKHDERALPTVERACDPFDRDVAGAGLHRRSDVCHVNGARALQLALDDLVDLHPAKQHARPAGERRLRSRSGVEGPTAASTRTCVAVPSPSTATGDPRPWTRRIGFIVVWASHAVEEPRSSALTRTVLTGPPLVTMSVERPQGLGCRERQLERLRVRPYC